MPMRAVAYCTGMQPAIHAVLSAVGIGALCICEGFNMASDAFRHWHEREARLCENGLAHVSTGGII